MKKIGIIHGRERSFPEAFCEEVNRRDVGILAESCRIEGVRVDLDVGYDVIIDRISHDVPFYQTWLKQAVFQGVRVINDPFWRIADDKYFGTCMVGAADIAVPRTLLLPQHSYVEDISDASLSNMTLVNWEDVASYVGLPCILKPAHGGGWKSVSKCESVEELIREYDQSGSQVMMVQEFIDWTAYARLLCVGKDEVLVAPWNPLLPHHERYSHADFGFDDKLEAKMLKEGSHINHILGYDMNTVEFAIRDGIPYAIDFTNTAPDFDRASLTPECFDWTVEKMADFAIGLADKEGTTRPRRWDTIMG